MKTPAKAQKAKAPGREAMFTVDLGTRTYRRLQDRSIKEGRSTGVRVPMTEIARRAIERELDLPIE